MNDSQNENLFEWNIKYTMQRFIKFPKEIQGSLSYNSCEAHPQNYMYTGPE